MSLAFLQNIEGKAKSCISNSIEVAEFNIAILVLYSVNQSWVIMHIVNVSNETENVCPDYF